MSLDFLLEFSQFMKKILFTFLVLLVFSSGPSIAATPDEALNVTITFDRKSIDIDEEIRMKIIIEGTAGGLERPRIPQLKGFNVYYLGRSSEIAIINGKKRAHTEFTFTLVPLTAGKFTIPPIEVEVGSSTYRTAPAQIEVLGKAGQLTNPKAHQASQLSPQPYSAPSQSPAPSAVRAPGSPDFVPAAQEGDEIFMKAWVNRSEVFVGEQVTLTYSIYYRTDATLERFEEEPITTGFWTEEFPAERRPTKRVVKVGGLKYETSDFRKIALFPTRSGIFGVEPGTVRAMVIEHPKGRNRYVDDFFGDSFFKSGGFFARKTPRILRANPIKITAKPLPEKGKPVSFRGAVGDYRFEAVLNKRSVRQNEPLALSLTVEGAGNVETIERPDLPTLEGVKIFETDSSSQVSPDFNIIQGRKTYELTLIPSQEGMLTIPPIEFSYFNPGTRSYHVQKSKSFKVKVEKGDPSYTYTVPEQIAVDKKTLEIEESGIHFIRQKDDDNTLLVYEPITNRILSGLAGLLTIATLVLFWNHRKELFYSQHKGLKRRLKAQGRALRGIRKLKGLTRDQSEEKRKEFFAQAHQVMSEYLADKFNVSAGGLTLTEIEAQMEHFAIEDEVQKQIKDFYEVTDRARFALNLISEDEGRNLIKILEGMVKRLEKKIR